MLLLKMGAHAAVMLAVGAYLLENKDTPFATPGLGFIVYPGHVASCQ